MKRPFAILALGLAVGLISGCSSDMMSSRTADSGPQSDTGRNSRTALNSDQQFIADTAAARSFELQASELALQKSSDAKVKSLAQRILDEGDASDIMSLARREGVAMPPTMSLDQQKALAQLMDREGESFDREYLKQIEKSHREIISEAKSQARQGSSEDVRSFSEKNISVMEDQLRAIRGETGSVFTLERD